MHNLEVITLDTLAFISKYEEILKSKKLPKMQFYKDCGITDAAVSQWRKGKTNPAMTTINRISEYLGVSVAYLIGEDQKEQPATVASDELSEDKRYLLESVMKLSDSQAKMLRAVIEQVLSETAR